MLPEAKPQTTCSSLCPVTFIRVSISVIDQNNVPLIGHELVNNTKMLQTVLLFNDILGILRGKSLNFEGKIQKHE